jgi:bacterioferritin
MQAKEGVIELLNRILTVDLTAINQYFLHAKMCEHWGYARLHHTIRQRSIDEMRDVEALLKHILYLDGVPNVQRLGTVTVGETVPEQFTADLTAEHEMLALLTEGVTHCARVGDYTTRHMLEVMVQDVDAHIDWIETQQELIRQVGLEQYLSEQIKKEAS